MFKQKRKLCRPLFITSSIKGIDRRKWINVPKFIDNIPRRSRPVAQIPNFQNWKNRRQGRFEKIRFFSTFFNSRNEKVNWVT